MNKAELDQLLDNKEDWSKWSPETRQALRELADRYDKEVPIDRAEASVSTESVIDAYLVHMADGGAAEGYLEVRARKLKFFARQYPELPASPEPLRVYLRQFKTADVPTRQDQWKALSALYKYAYADNPDDSPMLKVDKPRFKKKSGQRLSRDQAKLLLSVVETDLEWALVSCYFGLRFRRVEAERLLFTDIQPDYLIVRGKERTEELPLLPIFRDKLLKLQGNHDPDGPVFGIKADTLAYHITQLFKRAGIKSVRGSPHTLRNTAGALWSTFGGDWTSNRQLLRHSAKTMTDHYSPLTIDELRVKDERYNPMLCLMRELGLVSATDYQNTTGVLIFEAKFEADSVLSGNPAQLIRQLLDYQIALGDMAREISHALGGNGHCPELTRELIEELAKR